MYVEGCGDALFATLGISHVTRSRSMDFCDPLYLLSPPPLPSQLFCEYLNNQHSNR